MKEADHYRLLEPFSGDGEVNVISETPKGSRIKFKYDPETGLFQVGSFLPLGAVFPFDFGFIPCTLGADGDALDLLVLMDEPAFSGCVVKTRLVGAIEAEQVEKGVPVRNDRLIGVASRSRMHSEIQALENLNSALLEEIEHFFISYNEMRDIRFRPQGRHGPNRARELVLEGMKLYRERSSSGRT